MSQQETLTQARVKAIIKKSDIHFVVDDDDDIKITFDTEGKYNGDILVFVSISKQGVLSIKGFGSKEMSKSKKAEYLLICNQWNEEKVWPKCYYSEKITRVICEHNVDCEKGIGDETLSDNIIPIIATILQFHKYVYEKLP